jgi:hypothetical protein
MVWPPCKNASILLPSAGVANPRPNLGTIFQYYWCFSSVLFLSNVIKWPKRSKFLATFSNVAHRPVWVGHPSPSAILFIYLFQGHPTCGPNSVFWPIFFSFLTESGPNCRKYLSTAISFRCGRNFNLSLGHFKTFLGPCPNESIL